VKTNDVSPSRGSIQRWRFFGIFGLLIASLALTACGSSSDESNSTASGGSSSAPTTLKLGYQLIPNGDAIVKAEGYLEEALPDTEVKWVKFDSGADVNTAIAGGSIDIGLAGSSPVTTGIATGLDYRVPWIFDVIGEAESLVVSAESGITDLAGLEGKKIATPVASTAHYSLLAAVEDAGVDPESIQVVDLEPEAILAAWTRGDIDGAYIWNPTLAELIADGGTVLATSAELAEKGKVTADLAVVRTEFADQYPDAVQAWVDAQNRAVELYNSDPETASAAIAAELSITPAEALEQTKGLKFLTAAEQASSEYLGGGLAGNLESAAQFLASLGELPSVPPEQKFAAALAPQFVQGVSGG
jgi:taurine transport system substrate-binding protein